MNCIPPSRYELLEDAAQKNHGRAVIFFDSVIFKLCETCQTGVSHFKPPFWTEDTDARCTLTVAGLLRHTDARPAEEVEMYGGDFMAVCMLINQTVVRLVVVVKVCRHDGETFGIV